LTQVWKPQVKWKYLDKNTTRVPGYCWKKNFDYPGSKSSSILDTLLTNQIQETNLLNTVAWVESMKQMFWAPWGFAGPRIWICKDLFLSKYLWGFVRFVKIRQIYSKLVSYSNAPNNFFEHCQIHETNVLSTIGIRGTTNPDLQDESTF
jgi:hypothetical protein